MAQLYGGMGSIGKEQDRNLGGEILNGQGDIVR